MLGYAWQKGWVPMSLDALMRAVELNAAAVEMNKTAFNWGRLAAHDIEAGARRSRPAHGAAEATLATGAVAAIRSTTRRSARRSTKRSRAASHSSPTTRTPRTRSSTGARRARCARPKQQKAPGFTALTEAVARYAFKLMAYKDEYEVARLYTSGDFEKRIRETFDGDFKLHFNLAPPLFAKKDAEGHLRKAEYGPWVFGAFKLLAKLRGLRGTRVRRVRLHRRAQASSAS